MVRSFSVIMLFAFLGLCFLRARYPWGGVLGVACQQFAFGVSILSCAGHRGRERAARNGLSYSRDNTRNTYCSVVPSEKFMVHFLVCLLSTVP